MSAFSSELEAGRPIAGVPLEFVRSIDLAVPADSVFSYASDFSRAWEWRAEVTRSTMSPAGPMRLGSELHEVARVGGRRVVTESVIDSFEPGRSFTFTHVHGPLPVSGGMVVEPAGPGSRLTYTLRVQLTGLWVLLAPTFRVTGGRTMARSLAVFGQRVV